MIKEAAAGLFLSGGHLLPPPAANHHYVIENVVDVLKNRASITINALEGLKVVDIIERIYALKGLI